MAQVVIGDDIVLNIQLYKDNAEFAIDSGATVEAQFLDENGFAMLEAEITCDRTWTGADWPNSLVVVRVASAVSATLEKGSGQIEIQVDDSVNTTGKKTWFVSVDIEDDTIA